MKHHMKLRAAAVVGLMIPAAAALGQYTGTSHPEDVPVTTSDDGVRQPLVYVPAAQADPAPAPAPAHTPSMVPASLPTAPVTAMPVTPQQRRSIDPDAMVVGDEPAGAEMRERPLVAERLAQNAGGVDIDANVVTRVPGPANGLPIGTLVKARMLESLSTRTTVLGAEWKAELLEPLMRDGRVLIPAGATMRGKVTDVHGGKRITGEAMLHLEAVSVLMPDGTTLGMRAQVIDTNLNDTTKVDDEGSLLRRDHKKEDAAILALTTGSGLAAGAVIAGPPGALIGAGLGAGVSTVLWLKQDRQAELPKGTIMTFELTRPMLLGGV